MALCGTIDFNEGRRLPKDDLLEIETIAEVIKAADEGEKSDGGERKQ